MKLTKRRISIAGLSAVCAVSIVAGASLLADNNAKTAFAEDNAVPSSGYFYENLTDAAGKDYTLAKKFYEVLDELNENGDFKDGAVDYSLSEILTSNQIKEWVTGNDISIPKAFGAARDAYLTDHPEVFYIDFYKLTISAAMSDDVYSAYLDSGREANLYYDNDFKSEAQVDAAISAFDTKINEIVAAANKAAEDDQYGTNEDAVKARYVNTYLLKNISYDDDAASSDDVTAYAHSRTAYGGIINGVAVCSGYSRAYKVVLDKLGIPCLTVSGYSLGKTSEGDPTNGSAGHEWNYVWLENVKNEKEKSNDDGGKWYAVDVTWNSTGNNPIKYMGNGSLSISKDHAIDGVISTSGYELKFPKLSQYDYGCETDTEGISYSVDYVPEGGMDDFGYPLMTTYGYLSYNGKGAKRLLAEDGLRMIYRMAYYVDGEVSWVRWIDVNNYLDTFGEYSGFADAEDGSYTRAEANSSVLYAQFAITDCEPDYNDGHPGTFYFSFDNEDNEEEWGEHLSVISEVVENKSYGTYVSAPHVLSSTPNFREVQYLSNDMADPKSEGGNKMDAKKPFEIVVKYNEPLRVLDDSNDIGISFECNYFPKNVYKYCFFVPLESGKMVEFADDAHTSLRFKFCPSLMFEHDGEHYTFSFTNVGSNLTQYDKNGSPYTSDKAPNPITFRYVRDYVYCSKCLPGGRVLVDCVAKPTLMMSNSDLSEVGFINPETNKPYPVDKRSQMMLVADRVNEATESAMLDGIDKIPDGDIKKDDIKTSETYDIELRLCGCIVSIPNGSKVKVSLGFPEGYGPEDEGVTFRLYHYKHDNAGNFIGVEEIPCVVTQFGIVATLDRFSPYMVAVVPADKVSTYYKTIMATVEGTGGKLSLEDAQVKSLSKGQDCTYTIKPDEGYAIYSVTLNGKDVTERVQNDKLDLTYDELLNNNEVEIKYISEAAKQRFADKEIVEPARVIVATDGTASIAKPADQLPINKIEISDLPDGKPDNTALIIACVVIAVVVVLGAAVAFVVIRKKQSAKAAASAQPKAKKAAKPAPAKKQPEKVPANVAKATAVAAAEPKAAPAKPAAAAQPRPAAPAAAQPKPAAQSKPSLPTAQPKSASAKPSLPTAQPKPATTVKPVAKPTTKPTSKK